MRVEDSWDEFHEEVAFLETRTLYLEHGSSLHTGPAFPLHRRHGANEIVRWGERLFRILIIAGRLRRSPRITLKPDIDRPYILNRDIFAPVVCELDGVGLTSVIMLEPVDPYR
jgi:hypothetical protein